MVGLAYLVSHHQVWAVSPALFFPPLFEGGCLLFVREKACTDVDEITFAAS